MKVTLYPNLLYNESQRGNPYVNDFASALKAAGIQIANPPHKNPLFSICFKKIDSDFYIFHWIEDIGNHKYGYLQGIMAYIFFLRIKLHKKKLIWFLHNREGHLTKYPRLRKRIVKALTKYSNHIITHATEGLNIVEPRFRDKVIFIDHPTKDRLGDTEKLETSRPTYDLLIWGAISRYKGVLEFLQFAKQTHATLRINILGRCGDEKLLQELQVALTPYTHFENRSISFEELHQHIQDAKFVLIPYFSESILSSGVLMDSLSFGAKVIGPNVGSFSDYASSTEIVVCTFDKFENIQYIVSSNTDPISIHGYNSFLQRNSWENFVKRLLDRIQN